MLRLSFVILILILNSSVHAMTLDEVFAVAARKNEGAQQSAENLYQAQEHLDQAKSTVYPNLSFVATYFAQPEAPAGVREFFPATQTTANFALKQPLFRGFREFAAINQRKGLLRAQQQAHKLSLAQLYETVAGNYLEILTLEQDLKNLHEQKRIYGERIRDLQARIRRGESNATEALTAQATDAALSAEIATVESRLVTARQNFELLTSLPADTVLEDVFKTENVSLKQLKDYLSQVEQRPDVAGARELVEASEEEVRIARGGHWPSLDLTGNYYVKRPDGYLSDMRWDVQLQLTFPLFEGGLVLSQTREALSNSRVRTLDLVHSRRKAESEITSLHQGLRNRVDQLAAMKKSLDLAEKNYQVLQRDFRRGLVRSVDVQLGLTDYRVIRRSYDLVRYSSYLDRIRLQLASAQYPASLVKELK